MVRTTGGRSRAARLKRPTVEKTTPRKAGSFANPEEVKKRNTKRFMAESERLRKEGLAANKAANTRGVGGNLAAAGGAAAKRAVKADKTKQFLAESERLRKEGLAANKAAANKRVKSEDGKSDRPSAASMRDSAAQRAALAKSEPKKESKPAKKKERFGVGDKYVIRGNKANVRKDQLEKTGLTQAQYMKQWRASGKRPTAATAKKAAPKKAAPKKAAPKKAAPSGRSFDATKPNQGGPGMASIKPPKGPMSPMAAAQALGARGEDEMPIKRRGGGMMKSKMKAKGMAKGGSISAARRGSVDPSAVSKKKKPIQLSKGGMKTKGYMAGGLKDAPEGNTGLKKLPKQVRNKMGFKAKGGMMKTKGYAKGGMKSKGYAKGGKVRGAGIARKGVRPAKMR